MSSSTPNDDLQPPRKRQKQLEKKKKEPRLFIPFRALGIITNHVPFVVQTRSFKGANTPRIHLLTCLGRSWALWEGGRMTLLFASTDVEDPITCLEMDGDAVWATSGPHAIKYNRGKEVTRITNPLNSTLSFITIFGQQLLALTEDGECMLVWNTESADLESQIQFDAPFTATSILHPATYLNKVLVASTQGSMQLWNIRSNTCIYKFPPSKLTGSSSDFDVRASAITALIQSPAIDVVGIGFASGEISIYDVRADECMQKMFMEGGGVRALSFRSDGEPILASASSTGHIALWDLNEKGRLLHIVRGAHDGAISSIQWIPGQPLLVTSGDDNSVKQWIFDTPTGAPRLLKYRSGHHAPPHLIRYYGQDGKQLLSASRDRSLRCTSIVRDSRSFELSQGSLSKKATSLNIPIASLKYQPVTSISHSTTRYKEWDDILTGHSDEPFARTWSMQDKKVGRHTLLLDGVSTKGKQRQPAGIVKAVCVTECGNFGLASSSSGAVLLWNLQSGIQRKTFNIGPSPADVSSRFRGTSNKTSAERCITGLATDALNRLVIASTLDGTLNFFDFHTTKLEHTLILPSSAVSIALERNSGLLAVSCDDMVIRIVDVELRRIVRELRGFRGRILDMTFSPDSRWLIATALDSVIRTFDIPTGSLIDAFRTPSVATSLSFSPTNDFLATAHVDSVGVYLWANRAQFGEVSFHSVAEEDIHVVSMPSIEGVEEDPALEALVPLSLDTAKMDVFSTPPQLDGDLITLTLLPRSRWQTLINLEVIQHRNKPKEPPKAPEQAPFFLPTLPGVETRFVVEEKASEQKPSRRLGNVDSSVESVFQEKLSAEDVNGDFEAFFTFAKTITPAALDLELRSLVSIEGLRQFICALRQRLKSHRDFEAVQAFQKVLLTVHGEVLIANEELHQDLQGLAEAHERHSSRVLELTASSLGTLSLIRDIL